MTGYETLWSFKTARFEVRLSATFEDEPDLSWDETGEVRYKVGIGEYGVFIFKVSVHLDGWGEIAADYLGNSVYANPREFIDHRGTRGQYGSYFRDMVHTACRQARHVLIDIPRLRTA